ncbi:prepilin peptidase [Rheinheimera sp. EpRS3]|uniref:prepilin peptidase n=1 Tax=Rheinheimera sp. EpRS3 TaxID=1712383 RepID=UPI00074A2357|nr:A24 family peptidase [Rheinheimera sp. EpRS3]KUM53314.1 methyltransferase [Rheinheimera sp. EpRS3]
MQQLTELFSLYPALFITATAILSLIIGSFLNVVIYRLPKMMENEWQQEYKAYFLSAATAAAPAKFNLAVPRSSCPSCNSPVLARDNIPVLSWLLLKGKCRSCSTPISIRYPVVEALTAVLSALVAWKLGFGLPAAVLIVTTWTLIALTFIDIDKMLLPDQLTLPLLWLALLFSLSSSAFVNPGQAIVGAAAGYLSLWSVYWLFKLLTGKEGMGYGDFKLLAVFGALLGWQQLPLIILLSSCVGAIVGVILLSVQGKNKATPIPFGPYIAAAGWIALLWGEQITSAYLRYLGL